LQQGKNYRSSQYLDYRCDMRKYCTFYIFFSISLPIFADNFIGHVRNRPPALVIKNETFSGPVLEIIELSLKRQGHKITWLNVPWARTLKMAKEGGNVDILPRHSMTSERYDYLLPIVYGHRKRKLFYFSRKDSDIKISSFEDLHKYSIGQLRGSFYSQKQDKSDLIERIEVNNLEQLIVMLLRGRIDIVVISEAQGNIEHFSKNENFQRLDYNEIFLNGRYFSIPKHSSLAEFYDDIHKEVSRMRKSNEIADIFSKYNLEAPIQVGSNEEY